MILENVTLGQYFPGDSPLHRMDPRAKILCAVALIVAFVSPSTLTTLTVPVIGVFETVAVYVNSPAASSAPFAVNVCGALSHVPV